MKLKMLKCSILITAVLIIFSSVFTVSAVNEVGASVPATDQPYQSYTYWSDVNASEKVAVYSKPMYSFKNAISAFELGGDAQSRINDVDISDKIYVLDGGLGNIYILDNNYKPVKTITNLTYKNEALSFVGAKGFCVSNDGFIYIADTENARVIVLNPSHNVCNILYLPESPLIPTNFIFKPVKVAVDENGYKYILSDGSYYGAILYSPETEFLGFFGANVVKGTISTVLTNLKSRLFSNDIKRSADELSLPYTLSDITVGPDNFIYTATGKTSTGSTVQTGQVCIYNPGGNEVLGKSGYNFADYAVGTYQSIEQLQDICGIAVDRQGFMFLLDSTYGRIFIYDSECNLIQVFAGGIGDGNQKGIFGLPTAIAVGSSDIVVTDSIKNNLSIFRVTDYGKLLKKANSLTVSSNTDSALPIWQKIIALDSNNQLAYRGIAKAFLDSGDYEKAMDYAYMGYDRENYGKAFKKIRNQWIEENFSLLAASVILTITAFFALLLYLKKRSVAVLKKPSSRALALCAFHPVESFREIKEKGVGSVAASIILLIIFYIVTVLGDTAGGFVFTVFDSESYNAAYVLLSTVGFVLLWTVSNWMVCTLLGGIGKLKEIFIVTCYCLIPIIIGNALKLLLTHVLVGDEGAFMNIMVCAFIIYAAFMFVIGIMRIHDYEFGKFLLTTALTVVAMLIIIFLVFLILMLAQQLYGWLISVLIEVENRI